MFQLVLFSRQTFLLYFILFLWNAKTKWFVFRLVFSFLWNREKEHRYLLQAK